MPRTISIERNNNVTSIWLNRPEAKNAFNPEMIDELIEAAQNLVKDRKTRVVIIRGKEKQFCAGADIKWLKASGSFSNEQNETESRRISDLLKAIQAIPQPTISLAEGGVFGGAMGILAVSDWVLAEENCKFGFPEVHLGIAPAVIWPYILQKVAANKALQKAITGKAFTCNDALSINLIDNVCPSKNIHEELHSLIIEILTPAPDGQIEIKRLTQELQQYPSEKVIKRTIEILSKLKKSINGQEGLNAFIEKRKPEWK